MSDAEPTNEPNESKPTPDEPKPVDSKPNESHPVDPESPEDVEVPPVLSETPALRGLPRVVSLLVLVAVVLLIGVLFFRVMATFLVPLFLAAVLVVVCKPIHNWALERLPGRKSLAALATTTVISLLVVIPTALMGWMAYIETSRIVQIALAGDESPGATQEGEAPVLTPPTNDVLKQEPAEPALPVPEPAEAANAEVEGEVIASEPEPEGWSGWLWESLSPLTSWYRSNVNASFDPAQLARDANFDLAKLARDGARSAVQLGLVGVQTVVGFLFGLAIMIFALYYFFADGPTILETLMRLSPLDDDYERELLGRFAQVSRAVVLATLLSAVVQGVLAGIGYYVVLDDWIPPAVAAEYAAAGTPLEKIPKSEILRPPIFLLTVLTTMLAIVPFVGAAAVWIPVVLWVYFGQGDLGAAIGMAIYGTAVVSSIDNVIKPYVLHGQSNLHPLLALLSVLGGIQLLGPVGILVGPMLVAFMQALLEMLRRELDVFEADARPSAARASSP